MHLIPQNELIGGVNCYCSAVTVLLCGGTVREQSGRFYITQSLVVFVDVINDDLVCHNEPVKFHDALFKCLNDQRSHLSAQ